MAQKNEKFKDIMSDYDETTIFQNNLHIWENQINYLKNLKHTDLTNEELSGILTIKTEQIQEEKAKPIMNFIGRQLYVNMLKKKLTLDAEYHLIEFMKTFGGVLQGNIILSAHDMITMRGYSKYIAQSMKIDADETYQCILNHLF